MTTQLSILIITYKRTELALGTIRHLKKNMIFDGDLHWHIADDGSPNGHVDALVQELRDQKNVTISNSNRGGVGHSMNVGMGYCLEHSNYILWLEDDWFLTRRFDVEEYLHLFREYEDIGMIRLAYVSPGLAADLIHTSNNRLWWKLRKGPQYTFVGHASLRTKKFCNVYGKYKVGLPPGATELYMCGTFNGTTGPTVAIPAEDGIYGIFAHNDGGDSLKNVWPEEK